ncbi:hypothetical protein FOH10_11935 [Nocardia otitidiscaviarum]|uniref:Core-binding (CB) domain-containing protein n=1 Tax=Nocardia otitidiscaviarum TaxID=1823 RepID=A0A516NK87_9NOCA|nr:hypothetical protein [Nocardia otitidiscaviarum]MCP9624795.1 hypothetical protein [Nocardia otitidiscaviarum]QDP79323.1 hypothetical protein FOH10_11935 [Nocardia otitidiscaviarum]
MAPSPELDVSFAGDDLVLRLAALAYIARISAASRIHTKSDLRLYFYWCTDHQLTPLTVARTEVERYMRWMQEIRRFKPATVARHLAVVAGCYRTCVIDGVLVPVDAVIGHRTIIGGGTLPPRKCIGYRACRRIALNALHCRCDGP